MAEQMLLAYFVLMIHPADQRPEPLVNEEGHIQLFTFEEEAEEIADQHPAASAWGYEIIPWQHAHR